MSAERWYRRALSGAYDAFLDLWHDPTFRLLVVFALALVLLSGGAR